MNELTVEELEQKVERVKKDLDLLRSTGDGSRKLEVLSEYLEFVQEELKNARQQKTS